MTLAAAGAAPAPASATSSSTPAEARAAARAAAKARELVLEVGRRHFGGRAARVTRFGGGLTNAVFLIKVPQGAFVVRTHDNATKIHDYLKEHWAMDAARAAGVPTPQVLEVGNFADGRPYMISEHIVGIEGRAATERLTVLEQLGRAAATLHAVRTRGFGPVFDWSNNSLSKHTTWAGYLADGFEVDRRIETLLKHRMITPRQAKALKRSAQQIERWRKPPGLHHGDLRLKNVIVSAEGGRLLALIDWESCASMPGPAWDLSLALHDLGIDEKEAFLTGYGMTPKVYGQWLASMRCFNTLNYANAVRSAVEKKKRERLDWLRLRLVGGLDLYEP